MKRSIVVLFLLAWLLPACRQSFEPEPACEAGQAVLVLRGTLTDEGVECQALRDDSGTLYLLVGSTAPFSNGARVCVSGRPIDGVDYCLQGIAVEVECIHATRYP